MEADWEVELGGGARVIEPDWVGFMDLRRNPALVQKLAEVSQLQGLAEALIRLNSMDSPVWTSKCDLWPVTDFDPDELQASPELAHCAVACYIDLLPGDNRQWPTSQVVIDWCTAICNRLRLFPLRCCRVDLIARHVFLSTQRLGFGLTAYLTACGSASGVAHATLAAALAAFADSVAPQRPTQTSASKIQ